MCFLFLHLFCSFRLLDYPDSVNVPIKNFWDTESIVEISYIIPAYEYLHRVSFEGPLLPRQITYINLPYGYINKLIFETGDGSVFYQTGYPASRNADSINLTLSSKN